MVEVGRDFCRSSGPPLLLKQSHLEPDTQNHYPGSFRVFLRMETPQLPWAACASARSPSEWKKCLLMFRWSLLFQLVPIASDPVTEHPVCVGIPVSALGANSTPDTAHLSCHFSLFSRTPLILQPTGPQPCHASQLWA